MSTPDLLALLRLNETGARTQEDIFVGGSHHVPGGRVYGGQVLAQAVTAAGRTLESPRAVHSIHGYFLRPGDVRQPITFGVDRIHDGRSFSTRRAQAYQGGVPIFSAIASFQAQADGLEHQQSAPGDIPPPEALATRPRPEPEEAAAEPTTEDYIEVRDIPPTLLAPAPSGAPRSAAWIRVRSTLPDDPAVHRAALAYLSDFAVQDPIYLPHGIDWSTPGTSMASLDHAMWWYRDGRADEWLLAVQESPSASSSRGLATGAIYSPAGELLAATAQEIMFRVRA